MSDEKNLQVSCSHSKTNLSQGPGKAIEGSRHVKRTSLVTSECIDTTHACSSNHGKTLVSRVFRKFRKTKQLVKTRHGVIVPEQEENRDVLPSKEQGINEEDNQNIGQVDNSEWSEEKVPKDSESLREDIRRSLSLLVCGKYDVIMHDLAEFKNLGESLEAVLRLGSRAKVTSSLQFALLLGESWPILTENHRLHETHRSNENVSSPAPFDEFDFWSTNSRVYLNGDLHDTARGLLQSYMYVLRMLKGWMKDLALRHNNQWRAFVLLVEQLIPIGYIVFELPTEMNDFTPATKKDLHKDLQYVLFGISTFLSDIYTDWSISCWRKEDTSVHCAGARGSNYYVEDYKTISTHLSKFFSTCSPPLFHSYTGFFSHQISQSNWNEMFHEHIQTINSFLNMSGDNSTKNFNHPALTTLGLNDLESYWYTALLRLLQSLISSEKYSRKDRQTESDRTPIETLADNLNFERHTYLENQSDISPILKRVAEFSSWMWHQLLLIFDTFPMLGRETKLDLLHTYARSVQRNLPDCRNLKESLHFTRFQMFLQTKLEQAKGNRGNETAKIGEDYSGEDPTDSSTFVHTVEPGWETAAPCLFGGLPEGPSERNIDNLGKRISRSLKHARVQNTCVFLNLREHLVVLSPRAQEAHVLRFSDSAYIGHIGHKDRSDERTLNDIIVEVGKSEKVEDRSAREALQMTTWMGGPDKKDGDENAEYGDSMQCFKGSYLVRLGDQWYVVPNPRWKRIWSCAKVLSKSIRPTALKAFMVGVTWEYVDAERSKLCKLFWCGKRKTGRRYLLKGSESLVRALRSFLPNTVVDRVGADMLLSTAQEFIASAPKITMRLLGPKRCWIQLYSKPMAGHSVKEELQGSEQEIFMDYRANQGHVMRPASLLFGSIGDKRYVRRWNGPDQWFPAEVDGTSRFIHIGKPVEGIDVEDEPVDEDNSLTNGWRIGEGCNHRSANFT